MSSYLGRARRKWRGAVWVVGEGPFALVAECRALTVKLYPTKKAARAGLRSINSTGCGGRCWRGASHYIYDLDTKTTIENDAQTNSENQHS